MNPPDHDTLLDHRARIAHEQQQTDERRLAERAQQISPFNSPEVRIRLWEKRHHLSLPRTHDHRLIDVVAADTGLTRADVEEEQRQRAAARPAVATPAATT